eukprot:1394445-Amorphochlora_amoeboformis.AAC.1
MTTGYQLSMNLLKRYRSPNIDRSRSMEILEIVRRLYHPVVPGSTRWYPLIPGGNRLSWYRDKA